MYKYIVAALVLFLISKSVSSQSNFDWTEETDIYQKIYDAKLLTIDNQELTLLDLAEKQPLLVSFIFTRCAGICSPLLFQLKNEIEDSNLRENNYKVLVLSFDPRDSLEDMQRYAEVFKLDKNETWVFSITDNIDQVIASVSFDPVWDEATKQFEHDALTVGIDTNGYITRKKIGLPHTKDIKELLASINHKFTPSHRLPTKSNIFSCFNYNPETGKNTPGFGLLFILAPALFTFVILAFIRVNSSHKE